MKWWKRASKPLYTINMIDRATATPSAMTLVERALFYAIVGFLLGIITSPLILGVLK